MNDQTPNTTPETAQEQEPFIPPSYLLILAVIGFVGALIVLLTQPSFGVVGWGSLIFGAILFVGWLVMAPQGGRSPIRGRTLRYGGTSVLMTILVLVALGTLYVVARGMNLRQDLTESDEFSLSAESRQAMELLGADPTAPNVRLLAFYGFDQVSDRDRDTLLFDEYVAASNGKVSYQFLDPDLDRQIADQYGVTRSGAIAVVPLKDGEPDVENAETMNVLSQTTLTNDILKVAAQGNFAAFFLVVDEGLGDSMSLIKQTLTTTFDWTVRDLPLTQLTSPEAEIKLGDPARDGEVVVIPGGRRPLSADELQVLEDYVNNGGDLIIFASDLFNEDAESLATDPALNDFLFANFGLRFNKDMVIDQVQAFRRPQTPVVTNLDSVSFITTASVLPNGVVVFDLTDSITVADTLPPNVEVSRLAETSADSYTKTDIASLLTGDPDALTKTDSDASGPFVVAASAENTQTGARIVLFGSVSPALDAIAQLSDQTSLTVAFNSLFWTTQFNDFFQSINVPQQDRPQDQFFVASQQQLRNISFVTQWLLPFGLLAIGGLVLWSRRERRHEA
ncbi:MAG: Gldg family protein [Anaerolineae bacterium]|nr:Gldg family protein [Anaerolineae bacterium]